MAQRSSEVKCRDSVFTTICDPSSFCPAAAAYLMFLRMWDGFWALFFLVSSEARLLCWFCKSCSARSLWDEVVEVERCHSPSSACSAWSPLNTASWGWSARGRTRHGNSCARLAAGFSMSSQQDLSQMGTDKPYSRLIFRHVTLRVKTGVLIDSQRELKSSTVKSLSPVKAKTNIPQHSPEVSWQENKIKLFRSVWSTCYPKSLFSYGGLRSSD